MQLREGKDRRGLWWGQGLVRSGLPRCQLPATLSSEGSFGSRLPQSPTQLLPTPAARLPGKMPSRLVAWSRGFPVMTAGHGMLTHCLLSRPPDHAEAGGEGPARGFPCRSSVFTFLALGEGGRRAYTL